MLPGEIRSAERRTEEAAEGPDTVGLDVPRALVVVLGAVVAAVVYLGAGQPGLAAGAFSLLTLPYLLYRDRIELRDERPAASAMELLLAGAVVAAFVVIYVLLLAAE